MKTILVSFFTILLFFLKSNAQKINDFSWENMTINNSFDFDDIYGINASLTGHVYIGTNKGLYYYNGREIKRFDKINNNSTLDILYFENYFNKIISVGLNNYISLIDQKNSNAVFEIKISNCSKIIFLNSYLDSKYNLHLLARENLRESVEIELGVLNVHYNKYTVTLDQYCSNYLKDRGINNTKSILSNNSLIYNNKVILNDSFFVNNEEVYVVKNRQINKIIDLKDCKLKNSSVMQIAEDFNHNLYFSINGFDHGLFYYDASIKKTIKILDEFVTGICVDKYNYIWIGILKKGLYRKKISNLFNKNKINFESNVEIKKIIRNQNNFYILTNNNCLFTGFPKLKLTNRFTKSIQNRFTTSKNDIIYYFDDFNIFKINNRAEKINIDRKKTGIFLDYYIETNNKRILISKYDIYIFKNKKLYSLNFKPIILNVNFINDTSILIASNAGIYKLNPQNDNIQKIKLNQFIDNNKINNIYVFENICCLFLENNLFVYNLFSPYQINTFSGKVLNVELNKYNLYLFYDNKIITYNVINKSQFTENLDFKLNNSKLIGGFIFKNKIYYYNTQTIWGDSIVTLSNIKENFYLSEIKYGNNIFNHDIQYNKKTSTEFKFDIFNYNNNLVYELKNQNETIIKGSLVHNKLSFFNLQPDDYILNIINNGKIIFTKKFSITPTFYQNILFQIFSALFILFLIFFIVKVIINKKNAWQYNLLKLESTSKLNQLNPHFIFNVLGPLQMYLIHNDKGMSFFHNISDLLRSMINHSRNNEVILNEEINFLKNYLSIQQEINYNKFQFKFNTNNLNINLNSITIPNLLIQPLLENSIQHGISIEDFLSTIELIFNNDNKFIYLDIIDDGINFNSNTLKNKKNNSIHIIRERLELMNPKGSLSYSIINNKLHTQVKIPFKNKK